MKTSKGDINRLCRIIQAKNNLGSGDPAIFEDADEMYATIDELDVEAADWETFRVRYVFLSLIQSWLVLSDIYVGTMDQSNPTLLHGSARHTSYTRAMYWRSLNTWPPIQSSTASGTTPRSRSLPRLVHDVGQTSCLVTGVGRRP